MTQEIEQLTAKQKKFFSKPRTMAEIWKDLFNGDQWAANHFQNKFIGNGTLQINRNQTIELTKEP